MAGPGGNIDENTGRRVHRKKASVDFVHDGKVVHLRTVDVTLQNLVQRGSSRFHAQLQLLQDEFGLAFDRSLNNFSSVGIERRETRDVNGVAISCYRRSGGLPAF